MNISVVYPETMVVKCLRLEAPGKAGSSSVTAEADARAWSSPVFLAASNYHYGLGQPEG